MRNRLLLVIFFLSTSSSFSQIKVTAIEKLPLPSSQPWNNAIFSPSGNDIYYTTTGLNGIWQYNVSSKVIKEITRDAQSGFDFSLSPDGKQIAYRRTTEIDGGRDRIQEAVVCSVESGNENVVEKGETVSIPKFSTIGAVSTKLLKGTAASSISIVPMTLGIENTKISLVRNGEVIDFDPLKNGQYIWPVISPDKLHIAAVEMDHGAFVCDLNGANIFFLGRCDSPSWTRDGKWIVGMDDRDDGHTMYSSHIIAVAPDGKSTIQLTDDKSGIALFPSCSPVENKIVFNSDKGEIFIVTYEEEN
jgi:Tol biopolymer transport system component